MSDFPVGTIQAWYGSILSIPGTWHLCDGSSGTPDLRDRFIVCSGNDYAVNSYGGKVEHIHIFMGKGHFHAIPAGDKIKAGTDYSANVPVVPPLGPLNPSYDLLFLKGLCPLETMRCERWKLAHDKSIELFASFDISVNILVRFNWYTASRGATDKASSLPPYHSLCFIMYTG